VLTHLPADLPGICIVQHIPPVFSRSFADRLNGICALEVREATEGDVVEPGIALIAPGDFHMELVRTDRTTRVRLHQLDRVHHQRPAADLLFASAARLAGPWTVGALLTGMGRDGAEGLLQLRQAGAHTLAQDEESCVVYGMPQVALQLGAVEHMLPLKKIAEALVHRAEKIRRRAQEEPPATAKAA
jgi:two-component system chemotaxis response regulator CheB